MSRHRDVRNMDYSEDYDGYDDVYGHSMDEDYFISPSHRQFLFNRENSRDQPRIGEYISTEQDIQEEDECDLASNLSDLEKAKLESCIEQIKSTLGPISTPKTELTNIIISNNYDVERATNVILKDTKPVQAERKEKDVAKAPKFFVPRLNGLCDKPKKFNIPSLSKLPSGDNSPKTFTVPKLNFSLKAPTTDECPNKTFSNLSDLVSSHLSKSLKDCEITKNKVQAVNDDFNKCSIDGSKLESSVSNYQIDLSVALKTTPSGHSLNKSKESFKEEDFEIPFFDCEVDVETETVLKSSLDIKEILNVRLDNVKRASNFGKILCLRYRRHRRTITVPCITLNVKRFNFAGPSPDDSISKHLKIPSVKVVASTGKTTNVTKGFEISQKESLRLTPRSQSPASGRGTPVIEHNEERVVGKKDNKVDVETQYRKERGDSKEHLYMVVIGHVDAGKSTLMGHLLYDLGQVNQKMLHKYEQESRKLGKQSFMYAWVLDETGEERTRGITMDVGRSQFETKSKHVTLLDAPGHKDFIPNMISGAGQADVALLVVDATRGEFETGFDFGGQTREHALLVRSLGVTQLAVAINKLDTVSWSKERFDEISSKLKTFLKQAGFREGDVTFVPCSGLTGQNLTQKPTENELLTWYNGPCLLDVIDNFRTPERPVSKPFRLSVNDVFKGTGSGFCVSGRVETGSLNVGDRVIICPNRELSVVKALYIEDLSKTVVFAGDQATVTLSGVEMQNVSIGNVLCDPQNPVQVSSKFQARIVVFNLTIPITKGFSVILHHQSLVEPAVVSKLVSQLNRSTGEIVKKHPRFLNNNTSAIVEIQVTRPIALELYSDCKELGRFMLRVGGVTVAAGLITKIIL